MKISKEEIFKKMNKQKFEELQKRYKQPLLKPVVVYQKKSGEIVRACFSTKKEELKKIDKRSEDLLCLENSEIPSHIWEYCVEKKTLKKKSEDILKNQKKGEWEQQLVVLKMQLKVAKDNKLKEAIKNLTKRINEITKQVELLGVV